MFDAHWSTDCKKGNCMTDNTTCSGFSWHRPDGLAMSRYLDFTAEATAAVGAGNIALLKDIDLAMNEKGRLPRCLEITEDEARRLAEESGTPEDRYRAYLAFLYEIEYRKARGPALWERSSGVVPCPDFMVPTEWQVRMSRMALYSALGKVWNWSLIAVVGGMFPFVILPVCGVSFLGGRRINEVALCMMGLWCCAIFAGLVCYVACRLMRGGRPKRRA